MAGLSYQPLPVYFSTSPSTAMKLAAPAARFSPRISFIAGFNPSEPSLQPVGTIGYFRIPLVQGHLSPAFLEMHCQPAQLPGKAGSRAQ